ncbi:unnamed protein product [Vicia faba]|uniref:Uncharacterized protein n=1 Tax=Vicia faba TaxID=3906 RepID=A0AAV0ZM86_VICFA|nr:unnamed protein product [Vicia faba]
MVISRPQRYNPTRIVHQFIVFAKISSCKRLTYKPMELEPRLHLYTFLNLTSDPPWNQERNTYSVLLSPLDRRRDTFFGKDSNSVVVLCDFMMMIQDVTTCCCFVKKIEMLMRYSD